MLTLLSYQRQNFICSLNAAFSALYEICVLAMYWAKLLPRV